MSALNVLLTMWLAIWLPIWLPILLAGGIVKPTEATPVECSACVDIPKTKSCPCTKNDLTLLPLGMPWQAYPMFSANSLYTHNQMIHGMPSTCGCSTLQGRDDYHHAPGIGSYKFHTRAKPWNTARKICNDEGGHLAIVNSMAEAEVLRDIFNKSGPVKGGKFDFEAFVGIHDLYTQGDWVTVHGEPLKTTGYAVWSDRWGGQPDNGRGVQHCGAFLREGSMDDVECFEPFPFFCEIPHNPLKCLLHT